MTEGIQYVFVKDIKPAQKNLNVVFIVLEVGNNLSSPILNLLCQTFHPVYGKICSVQYIKVVKLR